MDLGLQNKRVVVTGAGGDIGGSIAKYLNEEGAFVYLFDIDAEGLNSNQKVLSNPENSKIVDISVTDRTAILEVMTKIVSEDGTPEILINAAGIQGMNTPIENLEEKDFDKVVEVNLKGIYNTVHSLIPHMLELDKGKIINIASIAGITGSRLNQSHYAASKGGVISFTRSLSKELGPKNISVNAVAPGVIETRMLKNITSEEKEAYLANIPLQRLGTADDIGKVVLFLSSPLSDYVNGQVLNVCGGVVTN